MKESVRVRRQFNRGSANVPHPLFLYEQTSTFVLANLEYELRLFWNPIRLGIADGEHEFDL